MDARLATALVGLAASLALSVLLWQQFGAVVLFVFLPFVPLLFDREGERSRTRTCPRCGFSSRATDHEYCPRDGTRLERDG